jgi:hypothetical protein
MTADLRSLANWLIEQGVTHVAMESTGVYWKPVWNILEGQFTLVLANAQHVKNVPGRKTDTKDSEWLAELLQHGLLAGSFVPPRLIRDLRDLTRTRAVLTQESSRIASRIQKVLEDANIKLASVASDTLGKSGQAMLVALIAGEDNPEQLANLALGSLRGKIPQLRRALEGLTREHHRFLLKRLLVQWRFVESENRVDRPTFGADRETGGTDCRSRRALGHGPRGRSHCGVGLSGRDGHRDGAVPFGEACGELGRGVSRKSRERRQTIGRENTERQSLVETHPRPIGLGGCAYQEHLRGCAVPPPRGEAGPEASDRSGWSQSTGHRLSLAPQTIRLSGSGSRLF